jgi:hypothetical protein
MAFCDAINFTERTKDGAGGKVADSHGDFDKFRADW